MREGIIEKLIKITPKKILGALIGFTFIWGVNGFPMPPQANNITIPSPEKLHGGQLQDFYNSLTPTVGPDVTPAVK